VPGVNIDCLYLILTIEKYLAKLKTIGILERFVSDKKGMLLQVIEDKGLLFLLSTKISDLADYNSVIVL
jgi:hypothetical protein